MMRTGGKCVPVRNYKYNHLLFLKYGASRYWQLLILILCCLYTKQTPALRQLGWVL